MGPPRRWTAVLGLTLTILELISPVLGRFVVDRNSLVVFSPANLKGKHDCAIANFGIPQYGGSLAGAVVYPKTNVKGCEEFSDSFRASPGALPNFVLVDRGDCLFTKKIWHAQNAGASAVLVADDKGEPLITMDLPKDDDVSSKYIQNITIPSALIVKRFGEQLKMAINSGEMVNVNLDWREAVPHPDDRVEYELWTNSNDECGSKCDMIMNFVKDFRGAAQVLEKGGYTQFTPHYITWFCPEVFTTSRQCKSQCINHGRYCAPDPEEDFDKGYEGKDVVTENLRQLCVFRVANETKRPWAWWDYVHDFHIRCSMKDKKYNKECADSVIKSLGLDAQKVKSCMGDLDANTENGILKEEQVSGKLDESAVIKAICSGFQETTEPTVCLNGDIQTNECLNDNGGCWQDKSSNITACKDTFRGRVCECPVVEGVQFKGDGYNTCNTSGFGRCRINYGGCWNDTRDSQSFSACQETGEEKCKCPPGFKGDGVENCEDINECKEKTACQCPECSCQNTFGSYTCSCSGDFLYIRDQDTCISKTPNEAKVTWAAAWIILIGLLIAGIGVYIVYKYRLRSYMDVEVRAIMAQYMPLENQGETQAD